MLRAMTARIGSSRLRVAALIATFVVLTLPGSVLAHAELQRAIPGDGETVWEPVTVVSGRYSEDLVDGSRLELLDGSGRTVASGGIDPDDPRRMVVRPDAPLIAGEYTVRSTAISADGHVDRTRWAFTASPVPTKNLPTPTVGPITSAPASPSTTPTSAPSASAPTSPSPSPAPGDSTSDTSNVLLPIIAALAIVAIGAGFLLNRSRGRSL